MQYALFSFFWACATLFSLTSNIAWHGAVVQDPLSLRAFVDTALAVTCLYILLRPQASRGLLLLAVLQICNVMLLLPEAPNHRLMMMFANVLILLHFFRDTHEQSFHRFRSSAIALLIIVYFFAFFAKLNTAFFDTSRSCAVQFAHHVADLMKLNPQWWLFQEGSIWFVVVAEALLVLFLSCRSMRIWGVAIGIFLHVVLSFDVEKHFYDFAGVMMTLLLLGLPTNTLSKIANRWKWLMPSPSTMQHGFVAIFLFLITFGFFVALGQPFDPLVIVPSYILWQLYCIAAITLVFGAVYLQLRATALPVLSRSVICVLCIAILNGVSPYVGLKTRTAFSMYSNFRMEPQYSNHFLIPRGLDLFGYHSTNAIDHPLEQKLLPFQPKDVRSEDECIW